MVNKQVAHLAQPAQSLSDTALQFAVRSFELGQAPLKLAPFLVHCRRPDPRPRLALLFASLFVLSFRALTLTLLGLGDPLRERVARSTVQGVVTTFHRSTSCNDALSSRISAI